MGPSTEYIRLVYWGVGARWSRTDVMVTKADRRWLLMQEAWLNVNLKTVLAVLFIFLR